MRVPLSLLLITAPAFTPAATAAQEASPADSRDEIDAMQAEIARLSAQVAALEAREAEEITPAGDGRGGILWKGAPEFESDSGWSFKPRGRLQFDAGTVDVPDSTDREDGFGSELRRARLGVEGDIPGGFGYKFELDFAGNEVEVTDAILTYADGGFEITAGQHNGFQSLEELTSSRFSSFIERSAFTDAFGFERRLGISAQYSGGDVLIQGGVFSDNIEASDGDNWSADARAVFLPRLGDTQLHFGGSVHYTDTSGEGVRYRQRPLVHFTSERFVDTGTFASESEFGAGVEAAAIRGPFHIAGEAFWQSVDRPGALADPTFFGGYAEVGVFLTPGDTRGYKGGTFDRVKPASPVGEGDIGAIQVSLRYDYLDLVDAGLIGGVQNGYQASLVWSPTDYTRFMVNYGRLQYDQAVHPTSAGDRSYGADVVAMRAQVDF